MWELLHSTFLTCQARKVECRTGLYSPVFILEAANQVKYIYMQDRAVPNCVVVSLGAENQVKYI